MARVEDFGALLDTHVCGSECIKWTHTQPVLVGPADVASFDAELALLVSVRDALAARTLVMREGLPTPRFGSRDDEPAQWGVRFESYARMRSPKRGLYGRRR
ncbi:MAG: hypothetical protein M3O28_06320 [Actinomycetota bacterium]|nr:hypothetical protein [Actinomycetota bacterium]